MKVMSCVLKVKPLDWRLSIRLCHLQSTHVKFGLLILNTIFLALTGVNFLLLPSQFVMQNQHNCHLTPTTPLDDLALFLQRI